MTVVYDLANDINYPHLKIYRRMVDGVLGGYRVNSDNGYVMYDINDENAEIEPETGKELSTPYYCTLAYLPINFDFADFSFKAVPINTTDEGNISGN